MVLILTLILIILILVIIILILIILIIILIIRTLKITRQIIIILPDVHYNNNSNITTHTINTNYDNNWSIIKDNNVKNN